MTTQTALKGIEHEWREPDDRPDDGEHVVVELTLGWVSGVSHGVYVSKDVPAVDVGWGVFTWSELVTRWRYGHGPYTGERALEEVVS